MRKPENPVQRTQVFEYFMVHSFGPGQREFRFNAVRDSGGLIVDTKHRTLRGFWGALTRADPYSRYSNGVLIVGIALGASRTIPPHSLISLPPPLDLFPTSLAKQLRKYR